jgi:hypothetical protein
MNKKEAEKYFKNCLIFSPFLNKFYVIVTNDLPKHPGAPLFPRNRLIDITTKANIVARYGAIDNNAMFIFTPIACKFS